MGFWAKIIPIVVSAVALVVVGVGVAIALLVFYSSATVDYPYYGMKQSKLNNKVSTDVIYEPGRHFIGLTYKFLTLPRYPIYVDYSGSRAITIRTVEGLEMRVDISFQYRIDKDQVVTLFNKYTTKYETTIEAQASRELRDVGQLYTAVDFIENRVRIAQAMFNTLSQALLVNPVTLVNLQLREIKFSTDYENRLLNRGVQNQNILLSNLKQQLNSFVSQTDVILAEINRKITTIELETEGQKLFLQSSSRGNSTAIQIDSEAKAFSLLRSEMNFENVQLLKYLYNGALGSGSAKLAVDVEEVIINTSG